MTELDHPPSCYERLCVIAVSLGSVVAFTGLVLLMLR
jgi:hypothetical protein